MDEWEELRRFDSLGGLGMCDGHPPVPPGQGTTIAGTQIGHSCGSSTVGSTRFVSVSLPFL